MVTTLTTTGLPDQARCQARRRPVLTDDGAIIETYTHGPTDRSDPYLLIHGWGARADVWQAVTERLVAAGQAVITVDQRGHGRSTLGKEPISIERLGADLATVVAATGVSGAVLVGHSGGGYAVLSCLAAHGGEIDPGAVAAIALVATASHGQKVALPERKLMGSRLLNRLAGRPGLGLRLLAHTCGPEADSVVIDRVRRLFVETPPAVRGACFASTTHYDLRGAVAELTLPAIVVCGSEDGVIDPVHSSELSDRLANSELAVIDGAGHMVPVEAPDALVDSLLRLRSSRRLPTQPNP